MLAPVTTALHAVVTLQAVIIVVGAVWEMHVIIHSITLLTCPRIGAVFPVDLDLWRPGILAAYDLVEHPTDQRWQGESEPDQERDIVVRGQAVVVREQSPTSYKPHEKGTDSQQ